MAANYRFVLPDGQEHGWSESLDTLPGVWPGARVTHELIVDALGQGTFVPYTGKQPGARPTKAPVMDAVVEPAAEVDGEKPARKMRA